MQRKRNNEKRTKTCPDITWNIASFSGIFLKRIPHYRFSARPDRSICTACDIWCICPLIDAVRYLIASLQPRCTQHSLSLQRVDRHDLCDSNVTRSRGNFLELQNKSQSRESACVFLLVECSAHATGSSHMADQ